MALIGSNIHRIAPYSLFFACASLKLTKQIKRRPPVRSTPPSRRHSSLSRAPGWLTTELLENAPRFIIHLSICLKIWGL
uniref:Uncharacterized protein n=1 Tax=Globodera rostochiensis TaxID=31243 RepID=A0A914HVY2_GLORO